jgi:hypothetical protein
MCTNWKRSVRDGGAIGESGEVTCGASIAGVPLLHRGLLASYRPTRPPTLLQHVDADTYVSSCFLLPKKNVRLSGSRIATRPYSGDTVSVSVSHASFIRARSKSLAGGETCEDGPAYALTLKCL